MSQTQFETLNKVSFLSEAQLTMYMYDEKTAGRMPKRSGKQME